MLGLITQRYKKLKALPTVQQFNIFWENNNNVREAYLAHANAHGERPSKFIATVKNCSISKPSSVVNLLVSRR